MSANNIKIKYIIYVLLLNIIGCSENNNYIIKSKYLGNSSVYYEVYYKNICISKYTLKDTIIFIDKLYVSGNTKSKVKNIKIDSVFIDYKYEYYLNGKIKTIEHYNFGIHHGWTIFYDSITNKIIDKKYYYNDLIYFQKSYSINSKSIITFLKPRFEIINNQSQFKCKVSDSIPFKIFTDDTSLYDGFIITVYPINNKNFMIHQLYPKNSYKIWIESIYSHYKAYGVYKLMIKGYTNSSFNNDVIYHNDEININIIP